MLTNRDIQIRLKGHVCVRNSHVSFEMNKVVPKDGNAFIHKMGKKDLVVCASKMYFSARKINGIFITLCILQQRILSFLYVNLLYVALFSSNRFLLRLIKGKLV